MRTSWPIPLLTASLLSQAPAPRTPDPATPNPDDIKVEAPKIEPPKIPGKTPLVYAGKPLVIETQCQDEEITAFGLTCTLDEPCDIYVELAGIETLGTNRIFLTGNLHTSTTTLWSVLLFSEDSGRTWIEPLDRMRSTGLELIQFFDLEYGWISGQQLLALPRDPFLLVTNDGGKSWRRKALSSENRVGAIEHFSFESRTNGTLIVDRAQTADSGGRHELYESNTGGDSWSLRQVSGKPLTLKRPRVPNVDWRLRADGVSKNLFLEKRTVGRWSAITSFRIKVGECKPFEAKLVEPPPVEEAKPAEPPPPPVSGPRRPPTLKKKK